MLFVGAWDRGASSVRAFLCIEYKIKIWVFKVVLCCFDTSFRARMATPVISYGLLPDSRLIDNAAAAPSSPAISPYKGYFLWLGLQALARLALRVHLLREEQWLLVAVLGLWCAKEGVSKFNVWRGRREAEGRNIISSYAYKGVALACAVAGIVFQKALFV